MKFKKNAAKSAVQFVKRTAVNQFSLQTLSIDA